MAKKKAKRGLGGWAFLIGVILAVVLGFLGSVNSTWLWILVAIGLIVGFLNVTDAESKPFLLSGVVLIIASAFGGDVFNAINGLNGILDALLAIFVPAVVIVAIRNAFEIARD